MEDQLDKSSNHGYLNEDAKNSDSDEKEDLSSIGADNEKELVLLDSNTDDEHDYNDSQQEQQQQQQENDDTEDDERVITRYYVRSISPPAIESRVEDDDRQFFSTRNRLRHANLTVSHNSAFIRVGPTDNNHSDSGESNSNNSQNRQPSSLQQRQELPQAYPISLPQTATGIQVASCTAHTIITQHTPNDNNDNNNPEQRKKRSWKLWLIVLPLILLAVSIAFIFLLSFSGPTNTSTNVTNITKNTTITVANSTEEGVIIKQDTTAPSPSPSLQEEKQEEQKCFTNPLEIQRIETELYLNGHDSSIPRTYIICPNSFIDFFGVPPTALEFDHSMGSYFPLIIFRPNVSILCGSDGDIRNNCTLYGGFCNIALFPRSLLINYPVNETAENTTISGFQFTGATQGPRICTMVENSITVKNSHFYNNQNQIADILVFPIQRGDAFINVDNCTFENNTYTHQQPMLDFELDDIIYFYGTGVLCQASSSFGDGDMSIDFQVHNSKFINNTFFKGKFSEGYTSAVINFLPTLNDDNKNHTGSSPNKKKKKSTVGVYNSCFIGNKGYSSSLILGEDTADGRISYDLRDNFFTDNIPMHSGDTNNTILQQGIIIEEEKEDPQCKVGYQRFISTENRIALEIHENCPTDLILLDWPEKEMCTV